MTTELLIEENSVDTTAISRVVSQPVKSVWAAFLTPAGQAALLGEGATLGDKGDKWQAADGSCGVTRSYHPMEEIRFSWRENEDAPRTMVELWFEKAGDEATKLRLVHQHAGAGLDPDKVLAHWQGALAALA